MGVVVAQLSQAEIARRLPLWCALSEIFLDTKLDPHQYQAIARTVRENGFTLQQAEEIFRNEVAPAFFANLWSVAGEWQGWSDNFVRERVLAKRGSWLAKTVSRAFHKQFLTEEWGNIAAHLSIDPA